MEDQAVSNPTIRVVIALTALLTGSVAVAITVATVDFSTLSLREDLQLTGLHSQSQDIQPANAAAAATEDLRDPGEGCEWIPMSGYGIRFKALYCRNGSRYTRLVPMAGGFAIETEAGVSDLPRIEVFHKPDDQAVEDAIWEQLLSEMTGPAAEGCVVERYDLEGSDHASDITRYAIEMQGDYLEQWEERFSEDPSYRPCGYYGPREAIAYFEASDKAPDKFLYLVIGQDAPPFSENAITYLDETGLAEGCESGSGKWLSMYDECEYADREWCITSGGVFSECESACRHEVNASICTLQCVPVCRF